MKVITVVIMTVLIARASAGAYRCSTYYFSDDNTNILENDGRICLSVFGSNEDLTNDGRLSNPVLNNRAFGTVTISITHGDIDSSYNTDASGKPLVVF